MRMQAVLVYYERLPPTSSVTMEVQKNHENLSSAGFQAKYHIQTFVKMMQKC